MLSLVVMEKDFCFETVIEKEDPLLGLCVVVVLSYMTGVKNMEVEQILTVSSAFSLAVYFL